MKRPVPEAHMTSPPQMVSMPRMALPINSSYCALMLNAPCKVGRRTQRVPRLPLQRTGQEAYPTSLCRRDPNHRYTHSATNRAAEINCEATSLPKNGVRIQSSEYP